VTEWVFYTIGGTLDVITEPNGGGHASARLADLLADRRDLDGLRDQADAPATKAEALAG
jgi:hypothetical protein